MFVALGYHELNALRARKCGEAKAKGYTLVSYVSPRADHGPWLEIGENCLILDGVGIQPGVRIGDDVSLWNNTLIGHHSTIGDHCWIAAGATLGGGVVLGERSFVGLNATIGGELSIGADCFLGAATRVLKDAPPRSVFIAPATERFRLESDAFLRMTRMPALGTNREGR
ncbi:DapH/DapD/GlmU-related protein [Accumulibacter sp.]|uniref:DapH/DapD/GlmU-related protein n=1 Tax=Accumulibacter sp. TaxID=2053492 RepID=UPI00262ADEE0|nr:DapH/DapD/GlmU-related protein [Accumulibacter sp.]